MRHNVQDKWLVRWNEKLGIGYYRRGYMDEAKKEQIAKLAVTRPAAGERRLTVGFGVTARRMDEERT